MAFRWTRADSGTSPNDSGSSTVGMFVFKRYAQATRESPFEEIARCLVGINQLSNECMPQHLRNDFTIIKYCITVR